MIIPTLPPTPSLSPSSTSPAPFFLFSTSRHPPPFSHSDLPSSFLLSSLPPLHEFHPSLLLPELFSFILLMHFTFSYFSSVFPFLFHSSLFFFPSSHIA
jgi:hypothetical protein